MTRLKRRAGWPGPAVISGLALSAGMLGLAGQPLRAGTAQAQPPEMSLATIGDTEITCTNEMSYDPQANQFIATGNVILVSPRGTLACDQLVVQLDNQSKVETADAKGNVRIERLNPQRQVDVTATGATAQLNEKTDKAFLNSGPTGSVVLVSPRGKLTCKQLELQLDEQNRLETADAQGNVHLERYNAQQQVDIAAVGATAQLNEKTAKAFLDGGVTVTMPMERLAQPAVVQGQRADINIAKKTAVVTRTTAAPVKIHVVPKGTDPSKMPEPVELVSDQAEIDQLQHLFTATGNPVLVHPNARIVAAKIWFELDEKTNAMEVAHADTNVVADGTGENGATMHATGDKGRFVRATNVLTLTADPGKRVKAQIKKAPADPRPTVVDADAISYNTLTGVYTATGSRTTVPPGAAPVMPMNQNPPSTPAKPRTPKTRK